MAITDQGTFDLGGVTNDVDGHFLEGGGLDEVQEALASGSLPKRSEAAGARIGSPIARPSAVICIGQNYAAHAAGSGSPAPTTPIIFLGGISTYLAASTSKGYRGRRRCS